MPQNRRLGESTERPNFTCLGAAAFLLLQRAGAFALTCRTFVIEAGRAYEHFLEKLKRTRTDGELPRIIDEMLAVISEYEKQLFEYRGGKVYPRNVLLNKSEFMKKFNK